MNYKYFILLLSTIIFYSCIKEIDITEFTSEFGDFEQEYRVEALMLPDDKTAIIRIDKTISIDDESLFNCIDDNGNWVGSGCICETNNCPVTIDDCDSLGALWLDSNPFIDGYCDVSVINQENCTSDLYDLSWSIIDDVGIDGLIGDPTDENKNCDFGADENDPCYTENSEGEGNGVTDCGEPNVDDLEEITEFSDIHELNCDKVQIHYNQQTCNFVYSETAGTIYEGSGLLEFINDASCQDEQSLTDLNDLNDLYYDYGAWIPENCEEDFFSHYEDDNYSLYIECGDDIITNVGTEMIPYPVVFVNEDDLNEQNIGQCTSAENIYECLEDFKIDNINFNLNENNLLNFVSQNTFYQSVQYFDPYLSCFQYDGTSPNWTYYHGHPAVAYPPSDETNHFPSGNNPIIFSNNEVVVSSTYEDIGCYQYRMYTFSEGYKNYYFFSQLDLKDPVRSNLRLGEDGTGEVVIGAFGAISGETITFKIVP